MVPKQLQEHNRLLLKSRLKVYKDNLKDNIKYGNYE